MLFRSVSQSRYRLRTPELYDDTAEKIMEIPDVFMNVLRAYFSEMLLQEKIKCKDIEAYHLLKNQTSYLHQQALLELHFFHVKHLKNQHQDPILS